jgi:hypothetical protein
VSAGCTVCFLLPFTPATLAVCWYVNLFFLRKRNTISTLMSPWGFAWCGDRWKARLVLCG